MIGCKLCCSVATTVDYSMSAAKALAYILEHNFTCDIIDVHVLFC